MQTYEVELQQERKEFYSKTVTVKASSEEEAKKTALDEEDGEDWDWVEDETIETLVSECTLDEDEHPTEGEN